MSVGEQHDAARRPLEGAEHAKSLLHVLTTAQPPTAEVRTPTSVEVAHLLHQLKLPRPRGGWGHDVDLIVEGNHGDHVVGVQTRDGAD